MENLNPTFVIAGHGQPMCGEELRKQLDELADNFDEIAVPEQGRYVKKGQQRCIM